MNSLLNKQEILEDKRYNMPSNELKEIPLIILRTYFSKPASEQTLETFLSLIPGEDIFDYGNLLHAAVSNNFDEGDVLSFIRVLVFHGYNVNRKWGEEEYNFVQMAIIYGAHYSFGKCYRYSEIFYKNLFDYLQYSLETFDVNAKDKAGNSIIHTAIQFSYRNSLITLLSWLGPDFDIECKNNDNKSILETFYDCKEREYTFERLVKRWINYKNTLNKSKEKNNNKTELEIEQLTTRIIGIVSTIPPLINGRETIEESMDKCSLIVDDMQYFKSEITNKNIFDQKLIKKVKLMTLMGIDYPGYHEVLTCVRVRVRDYNEDVKKILPTKEKIEKDINQLEQIIKKATFLDIVEHTDEILLLKESLEYNFRFLHKEDKFISTWSEYEEKLKQIINKGIETFKVPMDVNTFNSIVEVMQKYEFEEQEKLVIERQKESLNYQLKNQLILSTFQELLDQVLKFDIENKEELLKQIKELKEKLTTIVSDLQSANTPTKPLLNNQDESNYLITSDIKDSEVQEPPKQKVKQKRTK